MKPNDFVVSLLPLAEADLAEILDYLSEFGAKPARSLILKFETVFQKLQRHPFIGRMPDDIPLAELGYRTIVVENYLMFYVVLESRKRVVIHRVIHGARDYGSILFSSD